MTPRERVRTALAHRPPDRVPFSWGFGPTAEALATLRGWYAERGLDFDRLRRHSDDILRLHAPHRGPTPAPNADHWGIRRKAQVYGGGVYQEFTDFPLAAATSVDDVAAHPWPDPRDADDAALIDQLAAGGDRLAERAVLVVGGNPLEIYAWLTGLEQTLVNLVLAPEVVSAALERITGYFEARLEGMARVLGDRIDLLFFADDLGGQQGPLLAPALYRQVVQPFHRRLMRAAEALLPEAFRLFHTDGSVFALLGDLIDAGVQVLEAVQTECADMAPEQLKAAWRGRLAFCGGLSVQQWLARGDVATVEHETRRLIRVLGAGGGLIAQPSHAIQVGTPPANVDAMLRVALGRDAYDAAAGEARL